MKKQIALSLGVAALISVPAMAQSPKGCPVSLSLTETRPTPIVKDPTPGATLPVVSALVQKANVDTYTTGAKAVQRKVTNQQVILATLRVKGRPVNTAGWTLEAIPNVTNNLVGLGDRPADLEDNPAGRGALSYDLVVINRQSATRADVIVLGKFNVGSALSYSVKETEVNSAQSVDNLISATQSGSVSYAQNASLVQAEITDVERLEDADAFDAAGTSSTVVGVLAGDLNPLANEDQELLKGLISGFSGAFSGSATVLSTLGDAPTPAIRVPSLVVGAGKLSISSAPIGTQEKRYTGSASFSKVK